MPILPKELNNQFSEALSEHARRLRDADQCELSTQLIAGGRAIVDSSGVADISTGIQSLTTDMIVNQTSPRIHPDSVCLDVVKDILYGIADQASQPAAAPAFTGE